jgi:hypothetical protein
MSTSFSLSGSHVGDGLAPWRSRYRERLDYITDLSPQDVGTKSCPANGMLPQRRIVARFSRKGKSGASWKYRVFNHLSGRFDGPGPFVVIADPGR